MSPRGTGARSNGAASTTTETTRTTGTGRTPRARAVRASETATRTNGHGSANGRSASVRGGVIRTNGTASNGQLSAGTEPRSETPKARGERTRRRVAEAVISLLEEGDPSPTAKSVANRAGVSVRLIFHHFADMEALYRLVMTVQASRHWSTVVPVDAELPLEERIERTVQQRGKLFDAVGPVRRAAMALATRQPDIAEGLYETNVQLRKWMESTFAPELGGAGRERRELLDAVDAVASWEVWDRLRGDQHLSAPAARRVLVRALGGLLAS